MAEVAYDEAPASRDQDIIRLDIAVRDALRMDVGKAAQNLQRRQITHGAYATLF